MRVVLYAEGGRDLGAAMQVPPGAPIDDAALGPAHVLVARLLAELRPDAARFEGPLAPRGRVLRGSDLRQEKVLRRALTWPADPPDLGVVLVDADGDNQVYPRMLGIVGRRAQQRVPVVVGVAVQELEAWLVADITAVNRALGRAHAAVAAPEELPLRAAKDALDGWIGEACAGMPFDARRAKRRSIAEQLSLDEVERRCRAFELFRKDLRAALAP